MKHTLKGIAETRDVYLDGEWLDPKPSQKWHNHSPDGFNWGYEGSGPSQLALAIHLKLLGHPVGYQSLKRNLIAKLPSCKNFEIEFEI
jgi:hypothetical protein